MTSRQRASETSARVMADVLASMLCHEPCSAGVTHRAPAGEATADAATVTVPREPDAHEHDQGESAKDGWNSHGGHHQRHAGVVPLRDDGSPADTSKTADVSSRGGWAPSTSPGTPPSSRRP